MILMIILKIGGSILTNKDAPESEVDSNSLKRIAGEIKRSLDNSPKELVIVHGAGSFGHPPAKKHRIGEPFDTNEYPKKSLGLTATSKRISEGNLGIFKQYLSKGFIPVIYGDVVLDDDLEFCVISGDQIIQYLASNLNPETVVLGTDVDGVYSKNPKTHDDAVFYEKFTSIEDLDALEGTTNVDVTGGMVGKIKELLYLADLGIESKIINAEVKDNIYKVLENENVKGTVISRSKT